MYSLNYCTFHIVWINQEGEVWKTLISQKTVLCFQDIQILHLIFKLPLFKSKLRCPQQKKKWFCLAFAMMLEHPPVTLVLMRAAGLWASTKKWPPRFNWGRGPNPAHPYLVSLENESFTFCRAPGPWRSKAHRKLTEKAHRKRVQIIVFLVFCPIWGFFKLN